MNQHKRMLYVGNLDQRVDVELLKNLFIPFGDIVDVSLPLEQKSEEALAEFKELQIRFQQEEIKKKQREIARRAIEEEEENVPLETQSEILQIPLMEEKLDHKGYAFVEFELPEDAAAAMDNLNRSELYGRVLTVNYSTPKNFLKEHLKHVEKAIWDETEGGGIIQDDNDLIPKSATNVDEVKEPATKRVK